MLTHNIEKKQGRYNKDSVTLIQVKHINYNGDVTSNNLFLFTISSELIIVNILYIFFLNNVQSHKSLKYKSIWTFSV